MTPGEIVLFGLAAILGFLTVDVCQKWIALRRARRNFVVPIDEDQGEWLVDDTGQLATLRSPTYVKHPRLGHCTIHPFACGDLWIIHPTYEAAMQDLARK